MTIEEMQLEPVAKNAATLIKEKYPHLVFTSGRRTISQQAHAMANNVKLNRKWIEQTYLAAAALQKWVDSHPEAKTVDQIAAGLERTMKDMPEKDLLKIRRHLTGKAFDIRPVVKDASAIKSYIKKLPGLQKFLEREGGLERWHAQFV